MVDAEARMKGVKPADLLEKCKTFLGDGWKEINSDNFDFRILTAGFGNRLFVCGAKENTVTATPPSVIVRLYGGNVLPKNMPTRVLTEASECIVFFALSERGWAPKLHGVFDGGRIEEFISSRTLTIDEFCDDPEISLAIARAMARYHTLSSLPVPKANKKLPDLMREYHAKHLENVKIHGFPNLPPMTKLRAKAVNALLNYDFTSEANWLDKVGKNMFRRYVLIHGDLNRGNTLCRLAETDSTGRNLSWDERRLMIDYEFSAWGARGQDIGNHFGLQVHDFGQKHWLMHKEYPSEARRRAFVEAYAQECKRMNVWNDWDENGSDSVEHIMLEAEFGNLCARIKLVSFAQCEFETFGRMHISRQDVDPEFTEQWVC